MTNKYIDNQYLVSFLNNIDNKNNTIMDNKKGDIVKDFISNLNQKNINKSINLACELHLSGFYDILISKLTSFYLNEINLSQPLGIIYLNDITLYFNSKYNYRDKKLSPLNIINDIRLRNFICFFITLCCSSTQRKLPKLVKIKSDDFNLKQKKKTLISKDLCLLSKYIKPGDPKDIMIPLSEIINLLDSDTITDREHLIIYWISWIFECEINFYNKCLTTTYRNVSRVDKKYCTDFIWIIWDMINDQTKNEYKKIIKAYLSLFKNKYTKTSKKSKANIMINAVLVCVNPTPKIKEPLDIEDDIITRCNIESLNSNKYYLNIIQKKYIRDNVK